MELNQYSWQPNSSNVKYSPVLKTPSEEFQYVTPATKMSASDSGNGSASQTSSQNDKKSIQIQVPIGLPEFDHDDLDNTQQTIEPEPDDFQQKEEGIKGGDFDRLHLFSRAGEGDGPTPTADETGGAIKIPATVGSGRGNGLYPDSIFNLGNDARSDFGTVIPESVPDVNIYQHKKTVAQGMMDLALFSANANQLRYVLESSNHPYFYPGVVLISISLIFQVAVGVGLLMNTRYNVKDKREICVANKISNFTIVGIFLVTVINVFISAFGVASNATPSIILTPRSGEDEGSE